MIEEYAQYRTFVSVGLVVISLIISLYCLSKSNNKPYFRYYYKGFLLFSIAALEPLLLRTFWQSLPQSLMQFLTIPWVLVFVTVGFILVMKGYARERQTKKDNLS